MENNVKNKDNDFLERYYKYQLEEQQRVDKKQREETHQELPLQDENGNYLLSGVLRVCSGLWYNDEENQQETLNEVKNGLQIRSYMPLKEKVSRSLDILMTYQVLDDNVAMMAVNLEIGKIVLGLLEGYCINIKNDLDVVSLQLDTVDLLYRSGLADYILSFCQADYDRFVQIVDNSVNYNRILDLITALESFDSTYLDDFNEAVDHVNATLTPDKINFLNTIFKKNNKIFEDAMALAEVFSANSPIKSKSGETSEENEEKKKS